VLQTIANTQKQKEKGIDNVTEQYNNSILWKEFKKLSFILRRLLSKKFSIPSPLLSVSAKSTCIRQQYEEKRQFKYRCEAREALGLSPTPFAASDYEEVCFNCSVRQTSFI
jgi:hypothetical protein